MKTNLDTVQTIYEAFGHGDIPTILEHLADDIQWEAWANNSAQRQGIAWMQPYVGKNAVPAFFQTIGQLNITDFQIVSIMAGGHQVAAEFIIETGPSAFSTGYRDEEMHLWTFNDDGKVIRLRHYLDTFKHIQAATSLANINT